MAKRKIKFGIIGGGMMGREFASAVSRWHHLLDLDFQPEIAGVSSRSKSSLEWFETSLPGSHRFTTEYRALLDDPQIEAVYIAVPHDLHETMYRDALQAGKHLFGEKPFGIDRVANSAILADLRYSPQLLARCSSEFPFFPGAYQIAQMIREERFGQIIEVEAGFWHSSDLDPNKPINWKRMLQFNGEYGCMGDLGMHVVHLPFRAGWRPRNVRALLSKVVKERPDQAGRAVPCETWDNAVLACEVAHAGGSFPMVLSCKRIMPGHTNTWFLKIYGTALSAEFSTQYPKHLRLLPYTPGSAQDWRLVETQHRSAYVGITGNIFEFGFSDAMLQMIAAFCDELAHGREGMIQPLYCATPEETALSHELFTAALESQKQAQVIKIIEPSLK